MSKKKESDNWINCPECKIKLKQQNLAYHMKHTHNKKIKNTEIKPLETSNKKIKEKKSKNVTSKTAIAIIIVIFIIISASISIYFLSNYKNSNNQNNNKNYFVSIQGKGNYTSIQAAINSASNNDIIYVKNGTIYENIIITKPLELKGENKNTTIINGNASGSVIQISADNVKISDFTITNAGTTSKNTNIKDAAGIKIESNYNTISNCNISSNLNYGLYLYANPKNTNNIIKNNTFYNNRIGLITGNSKLNNVTSNIFTENTDYGLYFEDQSNENMISKNTFIKNNYGLRIKGSEKNTVMKNLIMNNKYGLYFCCGSKNNTVYNNIFINNTDYNADETLVNKYDNGQAGNYWDDYNGIDADSNGIGDTAYIITSDTRDRYPLMQPTNNANNPTKVKILGYNVTTEWTTGCCGHFENHIEPGFYPTEYMGYGAKYIIKGEIKNIAKEDIFVINININFLAKNGTVLFNTELLNLNYNINQLSKADTKSFIIEVYPEIYNYYNDPDFYNILRNNFIIVKSLEFNISTW